MLKKENIFKVILLSFVVFGSNFLDASTISKKVTTTGVTTTSPSWVYIPSISLNTNIINVGVTKEGNLDVPNNYTEVGWYKYGTLPGNIGSAVLDGHVDNGANIPGPFKKLRNVKEGDEIYVFMKGGKTLKYTVQSKAIYDTKKFPGELIFHDKSDALLKIITCHGTFVPSEKTYDQRLVVTAVLAKN